MSRYQWPIAPAGAAHEDEPGARGRFMARRRLDFDPEGARIASRGQPGAAPRGALRAPPDTRTNLWQPLGPQTVIAGQAAGRPRISGRISALCVHPLGLRLYAASANGGVWYSGDGGANWASLAGLASTDTAGITRPAHRNACGAIDVNFGATAAADVVWVGTGEVSNPIDGQPGSSLGGIGILRAEHPATSADADPWKREANNLTGTGVYKIVREPGGTRVVAATRRGLYERPAAGGPGVDWQRVAAAPFDTLEVHCTDALWTAADGARPARLWVWVKSGDQAGLWVRDGAGAFNKVAISGAGVAYSARRAALAASTPPTQVWVLNDAGKNVAPLLFRVATAGAAAPVATRVQGLPNLLGQQGSYDIAIDVDPNHPDRVVLGGSFLATTTPEGVALSQEAAIVVGDVALDGAVLTFGHPTPFTMIGIGAHADVHGLYYSNGGARLWSCCDGGVFRSDQPLRPAGFYACNNGLQVVESNYIANHPNCDGFVAAGLQDNASIQRHSSGVWTRVRRSSGDGGGILVVPLHPQNLLYQYIESNWSTSDGTLSDADMLTRGGAYAQKEADASAFYSTAAGIATTRTPAAPNPALAVGQVIIGTTRLWYTEETRQQVAPFTETPLGGKWFTLPTGTDPLPADTDRKQDDFGEAITVCRWQDRDVAWVLGEGHLARYARVPGSDSAGAPGTWSRETILKRGVKNKKDGSSADGPVRDSPVWTDIAVNLDKPLNIGDPPRQHGSRGALYLGTIGKADSAEVDTLWWFDGTSKWFQTHLRTDAAGVPAPVTAIVCDPAFPEEVYVGTTVGVWKGIRTQIGAADPAWTWHKRLNGLPEAAVEDLAIFNDGNLRLLRAGIAARGVWELRLDTADLVDRTYVRAHGDDLRYRDAVTLQRDGRTTRSWHGSPDLRPRTAVAALAAPATLPWSIESSEEAGLRRFQTALRSSTGDPRVRATGQWDAYFSEVLRDLGAPVLAVPPAPPKPARNLVSITAAFWNLHMKPPHATAEPWGAGTPSEADLIEFTADLNEGDVKRTSCTLPRLASKVDVVVHHRGLDSMDGANARVTLLKWIDPKTTGAASFSDSSTWFNNAIDANVPWTDAVNEVLNSAAGTTAKTFGGGWSFVGSTAATRRRTLAGQTLDALHSGVATFDLNLAGGVRNNAVVILVAVIRTGTGAASDIALTADSLRHLALTSPNVAVRSIRATP
jgi:hypothetical protein